MVRAQCAGLVVGEDIPLPWLRPIDSGWDAACRGVAGSGVRFGGGTQALARGLLVGTGSPWPGPAAVALSAVRTIVLGSSRLRRADHVSLCWASTRVLGVRQLGNG
ncbi:hypothetical protein GCM10009608_86150 [Pseudonocardia alaniniphila]